MQYLLNQALTRMLLLVKIFITPVSRLFDYCAKASIFSPVVSSPVVREIKEGL